MNNMLRKLQAYDAVVEGVVMGIITLATFSVMVLSIAQI